MVIIVLFNLNSRELFLAQAARIMIGKGVVDARGDDGGAGELPLAERLEVFLREVLHLCCLIDQVNGRLSVVLVVVKIRFCLQGVTS